MRSPAMTTSVPWENKVPAVTLAFWVIKILSTTVGETGADFLAADLGLGGAVTTSIMIALLAGALWVQMSTPIYRPWKYWLSVVLVSVVGTLLTDILTDVIGVPLAISTVVFAVWLLASLCAWYKMEGTLSIQAINTPRRELFYWVAILLTFALGTAAGDFATEALQWGFARGVLAFGTGITAVGCAYYMGANAVLSFWLVYVLTRPLGASLGDLLTQSPQYGGLGLGTLLTSALFLAVIVVLVATASRHAKIAVNPEPGT